MDRLYLLARDHLERASAILLKTGPQTLEASEAASRIALEVDRIRQSRNQPSNVIDFQTYGPCRSPQPKPPKPSSVDWR